MEETRMPPSHAANLVANSADALYGVYVIGWMLNHYLNKCWPTAMASLGLYTMSHFALFFFVFMQLICV